MTQPRTSMTILIVDDDTEDRMMMADAFAESHIANPLRFVENGEQLMDYLYQRGAYADPASAPRPGLIILDLNMPKKDGLKALQEIKSDPRLRHMPVVV
jgi:CheY-like chemotaxis protein